MADEPNAGFDWREIVCPNERAARGEAKRQQEQDDTDEAEWIYLRNKAGEWVARRTPRHLEVETSPEPPKSLKRAFLEEITSIGDPLSWLH